MGIILLKYLIINASGKTNARFRIQTFNYLKIALKLNKKKDRLLLLLIAKKTIFNLPFLEGNRF